MHNTVIVEFSATVLSNVLEITFMKRKKKTLYLSHQETTKVFVMFWEEVPPAQLILDFPGKPQKLDWDFQEDSNKNKYYFLPLQTT